MVERSAVEVLAEKLIDLWPFAPAGELSLEERLTKIAARLAEDPAITVRTDMVVERFLVEFHYDKAKFVTSVALHNREQVHHVLTSYTDQFHDNADHRIIVRPYPEVPSDG